jgi:hypothetical protein
LSVVFGNIEALASRVEDGQTWMAGPRPAMTMERPRYPATTRFERCVARAVVLWVPACAGMTVFGGNDGLP